ncbi:glycosyltransferase [Variovorax guangxiensis]|uniref:Glycosyltransferase n=1 Tax=Variovorax guangxiensis TaxID=1775474 RepID=A0A3S1A6X4_9BURK|nr:glycosyltransferase [Variovorax guangxiensis]RUR71103.1 glycosyltransferase [Variovorax guangxiensis]
MHAFVVIPCLNEEGCLAATCHSLGFPEGSPLHTTLVLVDNGSEDRTPDVMAGIKSSAPPGRVIVVQESRRGYVFARHAGAMACLDIATHQKLDLGQVILLQADADTIYLSGYLHHMCARFNAAPSMAIVEGAAITAREFAQSYPEYDALSRKIDCEMDPLLADGADDVVLDDKVCAFRLGDYFAWGGHQREFDDGGDEMFAETTRLYLRARDSHHATRIRVEKAAALPSRRKLIEHAAAHFASAGFPRQSRWFLHWKERHTKQDADRFLNDPVASGCLLEAVKSRRRHELALFGLLPLLVNRNASCCEATRKFFASQDFSPKCAEPAAALRLVLQLADERDGPLDAFLDAETEPI